MSSRQVVLDALNHRDSGRVAIDFGGSATTGIHCSCVAALREHYGLKKRLVKVHEPYQMLGMVDEDLKQAMGIDVEAASPRMTMFGFPNENWKSWRTPWQQEVLVPERFEVTTHPPGDVYIYPQGDRGCPPSGMMPASGYFFDTIIRQEPIDEQKLEPADNLEEFSRFSDTDLAYLAEATQAARATGRAVLGTLPGLALGDIALVPAPFLKRPRGIRDVAEWYLSLAARQDYVHAVFDQQTHIGLENLQRAHEAIGDSMDVVFLCGTDFGTQLSQFCSVQTLRELYMPYYRRINDWIHQHTGWKTFKHSCGAVEPLIETFIECGFDVLNPVQCSAAGMDPGHLKSTYGDRIVFWGGGIDTQHVLPFGTAQEVRRQVLERCEIFSRGGGFVFNSIHNVQARTPVANIVAMIDAVHEFSGTDRHSAATAS